MTDEEFELEADRIEAGIRTCANRWGIVLDVPDDAFDDWLLTGERDD